MIIKVKENNSLFKMFIVPSEKLEGGKPSDIEYLESEKNKYEITDIYTIRKDEPFPFSLIKTITGQALKPEDIWNVYYKSDEIFIFVVLPINPKK